jgi:hypothetical protein
MTQPDQSPDHLDVISDNDVVNERRRMQYGRRRILTVGTGAVAGAAVLLAGVALIQRLPYQGGDAAGTATPTTSSAVVSAQPSPTGQTPGPTTAAPTSSTTPTAIATTKGPMPADLHLSGPGELALTASDGRYHGTLTMTLRNSGPTPYGQTFLRMSVPNGITWEFQSDPPWFPCLLMGGDDQWDCMGSSVPARGGTVTITLALTADYAPGPAMTLPRTFTFLVVAAALTHQEEYADPTPADNRISVTVKLAAAS